MAQAKRAEHDPVDESRMSFGEHLDELRRRVIYALLGLAVGVAISFFYATTVINLLSQPLLIALRMEGLPPSLYVKSVPELFLTYIQVSIFAGLILASPWLLYQIWKFVGAGLYAREQRFIRVYGPFSLVLFLAGAAFVYLVVLPFGLRFFVQFNDGFEAPASTFMTPVQRMIYGVPELPQLPAEGGPVELPVRLHAPTTGPADAGTAMFWIDANTGKLMVARQLPDGKLATSSFVPEGEQHSYVQPIFTLTEYLGFASTLMLVFGIGFQMPLVILFLAATGLVTTRQMAGRRRMMVMIIVIVAAILTPPDVISQVLLAIPMLGLFELGLVLGRRAERRRAERGAAEA